MSAAAEVVVLNASGQPGDTFADETVTVRGYASPPDALARLAELRARGATAVLVLSAEPFNVPAVVLEAGRRTPEVPVIMAVEAGHSGRAAGRVMVRQARSTALNAAVRDALRVAAQQARVRTTLDRLNVRLRTEPPPDASQHRRLALSGLYLAAILEQARDGIVVTDRTGVVAMWNQAASRMFGIDGIEPLGRRIDEVVRGDAGASLLDRILALSTEQPSLSHELLVDAEGQRHLELSMTLVFDAAKAGIAVSLIARDVSGDRAMQRELERRARELAESNRHKDEFLAVVSHELRTPLNAVLGWAQILTKTAPGDEQVRRATNMITRNAALQRRLVEDLLDYARIAAGRLPMTLRPMDVSAVVEAAVDTLRPAAEEQGLRLGETYPRGVYARVDEERLRQVILNLVGNAVKFTDPGGAIHVTVAAAAHRVVITVADTGRGIDAEFLPFVFNEFRQEDPSVSRSESGLGLGLAIARRIIELHDGEITVESPGPGRGATFTITIPAAERAE